MFYSSFNLAVLLLAIFSVRANQLRQEHTEIELESVYTTAISLGRCALSGSNFIIQAGSKATFDGAATTILVGSVGVSPGTSITGNVVLKSGSLQRNTASAINCAADRKTAYAHAKATICPSTHRQTLGEIGGHTYTPGVYCTGPGYITFKAGTVTLDGQGNANAVWVFQMATSLITSPSTSFILKNGAQAKNVFWQVGSSATIGKSSSFVGTILAYAGITFGTNVHFKGRAFAGTAVTNAGGSSLTV
uniref:Ice-binding protein 3 n=1 Tax=Kremastochrysopsis austriaca TaxID=2600099 RepID=A0A5P5XJI6_9STRA|nr:ice-binding protein 3 [Kremastochrysopsis austriaca]